MTNHGVLYCVSNPDREGEFEVGFTTAHIDRVIHCPDASGQHRSRCLEFAKAIPVDRAPIAEIVAALARYGHRVASHPNIYVFSDVERAQIYEFFDIAHGAWCEVTPPAVDMEPTESKSTISEDAASDISQSESESPKKGKPKPSVVSMVNTFRHGQNVRHVLNAVDQTKTLPAKLGNVLTAVYCANTRRLVCADFSEGIRVFESVSDFALANLRLTKRSRTVNGWAQCDALEPDGAWVPVQQIRNRFSDRGGESLRRLAANGWL